jgi:ribose transport system substrate-binding protein
VKFHYHTGFRGQAKEMPVAMRFLTMAVLVAAVGCGKEPAAAPQAVAPKPAESAALRIAVVPKGTTHDFWKSIHAGAIKAEKELGGVQVTFRGPEKEDDREHQVTLVQNLISSKYDAIVLAPLDDKALVGSVKQATAAKIPVVIIDSGLEARVGEDFVSFVATDNERGGQMAGERLVQALKGKGKVLLLRYQEGSASTVLREKGFVDAVSKAAGITLIDPKRYAGPTRASAQDAAENLLLANKEIDGVFCPNESSTYGMLLALRGRGLAGKVKFVGFDASDAVVEAMRAGEIDGLVLQNPIRMGYLGVKTAVEHIRGSKVQQRIDTGVVIVTKENMETPESKELLSPDLKALLGGR